MSKLSATEIAYVAVSIALIAVCSWIAVPMTIPFTLQTFAVCLVAALLGLKSGLWATAGYMALGFIGVPVFSGFRSGPGVLLGPTGGYIIGFLFTALTVGLAVQKFGRRLPVLILSMSAGILLCYIFGTFWFMLVYARDTGTVSLGTAVALCVLPYLIPDGIKLTIAALLAVRLHPLISEPQRRRKQ